MLRGLLTNAIGDWRLVIGQNPTPNVGACLDVIQRVLGCRHKVEIHLHKDVLDGDKHPHEMLRYVFEDLGSDLNIFVEDDTVPTNDLCELAEAYANISDPGMGLCYYYHGKPGEHEFSDTMVRRIPHLASNMCFAATKNTWYKYLDPLWYRHDYDTYQEGYGYDVNLVRMSMKLGIHSYHVRQTRVAYIGVEDGLHHDPDTAVDRSHVQLKHMEKPLKYEFH